MMQRIVPQRGEKGAGTPSVSHLEAGWHGPAAKIAHVVPAVPGRHVIGSLLVAVLVPMDLCAPDGM
ncbi:hypothetical protein GCM10010390_89340 [Streptomyces mordarskii]|uniref:Uncharacterized protein n=1 Tax=Streptomyces mordarskii TaxID=1226758 RepID=A0ABN1ES95_9ACTN